MSHCISISNSLLVQQTALFIKTVKATNPQYKNLAMTMVETMVMMTMKLIHTDDTARSCCAWYGGCTAARCTRSRCHDDVLSARSAGHSLRHCRHDLGWSSSSWAWRSNHDCLFTGSTVQRQCRAWQQGYRLCPGRRLQDL